MKITDKIKMDKAGLIKNGAVTIVAFGDSVTHGAVADGEMNYDTVYHNRFRQRINAEHPYVPVNVINAGIGGITAKESLSRLDSQVLSHSPDLVIVCFGLNDVNGTLSDYISALSEIFERCRGIHTVFMTPNMLNTYVADDTAVRHLEYAKKTAEFQNGGKMDEFMTSAVRLAEDMGVTVCDCYSEWKRMSDTCDTTQLLANRINHPSKEMHELFADMLYNTVFGNECSQSESHSTMFEE